MGSLDEAAHASGGRVTCEPLQRRPGPHFSASSPTKAMCVLLDAARFG